MRRLALLALLAGLALPAVSQAQMPLATGGRVGLGLGSGSFSSGIAGKLYLSPNMSAQAVVGGWGWLGWGGLAANVDVLWEQAPLADIEPGALNWYFGVGGNVILGSGFGLGPSAIIGLGWQFKQVPIDITAEYRPTFMVGNATGSALNFGWGGGSVRYFF